ncbi:MAG TPA: hypothetical protein VFA26_00905 [Gemmataceae bacterium]|nr:hypothetical protein [Gemmataceae bacterium]
MLRNAGVVECEKQGRFAVYRLCPEVFRPTAASQSADYLDLGCCRLEIPKE